MQTNHRCALPLRGVSVIQMSRCRSRFLSAVIADLCVMATASIASVNRHVCAPDADVVRGVVRVWMTDTVRADALHYACVFAPVQRPRPHVVVGRVVDAAVFAAALRFVVRSQCYVLHKKP